jgi:hypothetical protein
MQVSKERLAALPVGRRSAAYDLCGSMRTVDRSKNQAIHITAAAPDMKCYRRCVASSMPDLETHH